MSEAVTHIASVVEGHSEVQSLPILIRRVSTELLNTSGVVADMPWRLPRGRMAKPALPISECGTFVRCGVVVGVSGVG